MIDTKVETTPAVKEERLPRQWGLHPEKVMLRLQNTLITVVLTNGEQVGGQLVGYSEFQLVVRTATGVVVISKGQVVTLRPSKPAPVEGEHGTT